MRYAGLIAALIVLVAMAFVVTGCEEAEEAEITDGTYEVESDYDERGWKARLEVRFEDGAPVEVDYDEINEDGERKSEDEAYNERWRGADDIDAVEAFAELESRLIEAGEPAGVDTVTGATGSTERFVELAERAFDEARAAE